MNLDEAKETLEGIGIADTVTDELVEASTLVLDALETALATSIVMERPKIEPEPEPPTGTTGYWDRYFRDMTAMTAATQTIANQSPWRDMMNDTTVPPQAGDWVYDATDDLRDYDED